MSTITTDATLTTDDIRALRSSSRWVSFYARWTNGELTESRIVGKRTDVAGDDYTSAQVDVGSSLQFGGSIIRDNPDVRAYCSVMCPTVDDHWRTFLGSVRNGDHITLMWNANGHRNAHVKRAGLAVDGLDIRVTRGRRTMWFHVDMRVTAYDSARMFTVADTSAPITSDQTADDWL